MGNQLHLFGGPGRVQTLYRTVRKFGYLAQAADKAKVTRLTGISWQTVGSIVERVVRRCLNPERLKGLRTIGVDEFNYRKRHHYLTVVADHEKERVVWTGKGRSAEVLKESFEHLGPDGRASIATVTVDLAGDEAHSSEVLSVNEGSNCPDGQKLIGTYGLPVVGRFGLGHSLLAWARCELWCRDNAVRMLAPNWNYLRVGPYLRRELDKREYHRLFTFRHYITGVKRALMLLRLPHVPADVYDARRVDVGVRQLVVFENLVSDNFKTYGAEIARRRLEVRAALRRMTKPKYLPEEPVEPHVAVHVRLGDFGLAGDPRRLRDGATNTRLPIQWYVSALTALRQGLGRTLPAWVYSDGGDDALAPLLVLPLVRRARRVSAVTDLLAMSHASVLVGSGSNFSAWGALLGAVPRVCYPGQRLTRVLGSPSPIDLEPEIDYEAPIPLDFLRVVGKRSEKVSL